jgi:hypothetical protein
LKQMICRQVQVLIQYVKLTYGVKEYLAELFNEVLTNETQEA